MIGVLNKKICIVGDTQVTDDDNITVLSNDYEKIMQVGINCLVGFTGKPGICKLALQNMSNLKDKLVNPYDLANIIHKNFKTIYSYLSIPNNKKNMCQVVIGGTTTDSFCSNNKVFELYTINTISGISKTNVLKYPEKTIVPMFNLIPPLIVQKIIIEELNKNDENIEETFKNIVIRVHEYDTTVNDKPTYLEI